MAKGSHPPTFAQYGVERCCYGCRRPLRATEALWFCGHPKPGVFGRCCWKKAARWPGDDHVVTPRREDADDE